MCNSKTIRVQTKQSTKIPSKSQSLSKRSKQRIRSACTSTSLPNGQTSISKNMNSKDMFEVYSTHGLVAYELEAFGITRPPLDSPKIKSRKSRVSTEIHPDLLFAEFLSEE
mmetsp:Transcript_8794/g.16415  ORF Transcript_8794/g.16415 Transcript_8794/m.16415 type:complete len:111 (-) Transcript_8794:91-423(-)